MPALPDTLLVQIQEIYEMQCNEQQVLITRPGSNPRAWWSIKAPQGDLNYAEVVPVEIMGEIVDYKLLAVNGDPSSPCYGSHTFHGIMGPVDPPDTADPIGPYCMGPSGEVVCHNGKASVVDND